MKSVASCLAILVLATVVVAQQTPYTETYEVRIHNLDVVVTDKEGNTVRGLTKDDFIVTEAGKPQAITNFSVYDDTISQTDHGISDASGQTVVSAPPPRRFVFFIDDMAIQARARGTLKLHVTALIRAMRPGDVAAIVRPSGTTRMVQEYSGDPLKIEQALHKVIDSCKVKITNQSFAELQSFRRAMERAESPHEVAAAKRQYVDMTRGRVEQRISQLRALAASMAGSDGKKIMVVITSGLSSEPGREAYTIDEQLGIFDTPKQAPTADELALAAENAAELGGATPLPEAGRLRGLRRDLTTFDARSKWQGAHRVESVDFRAEIADLARSAAADGVTIYALEPEVPVSLSFSKGADSKSLGSTLIDGPTQVYGRDVVPAQMLNDLLHYGGETLTSLTETTGGSWFRGVGAIDDVFRRLSDDLHFYYSLAYRPNDTTPGARKVKVTVRNRPELKVRTRTEVFERPSGREMSGRVIAALLYPSDVNELEMKVVAEKPEKEGKKLYSIPIEVVIPVNKLSLMRDDDGTYRGMVSVHYASSINQKEFVSYGRQDQMVELTAQQYAQQARGRYRYNSRITVPKGEVRIVVGVVDSASRASSLQTVSLTTK